MFWTSWILAGIYAIMLLQAFFWYKRTSSSKVYISSDRNISASAAVVSAMMTSAAVPIFLILPQKVVLENGLLQSIIVGISVVVGFVAAYLLLAERLRIYSEIMGGTTTVPSFISKRFKDSTGWLRSLSASLITVFMVLLAAYALSQAAGIVSLAFEISRTTAVMLITIGSIVCLYLGGISASVFTDRLRSFIVLGTIIAVFGFILFELIVGDNDHSSVRMIPETLENQGVTVGSVISCIGVALGCLGFPTQIKRFLIIKERKPAKRFFLTPLIICSVFAAGMLFVSYIALSKASATASVAEFLGELETVGSVRVFNAVIDSLIFVSMLVVLTAVADGAILAAAVTFSSDVFNNTLTHETEEKKNLFSNKVTVLVMGFAVCLLSLSENTLPIMAPDFIWSVMGACFGPVILFSLYCKRLTLKGSVASMIGGLLTVLIWQFILEPLGGIFTIYEIIPGFIVSTLALYVVSYLDRQKPSARTVNEFNRMKEITKMPRL